MRARLLSAPEECRRKVHPAQVKSRGQKVWGRRQRDPSPEATPPILVKGSRDPSVRREETSVSILISTTVLHLDIFVTHSALPARPQPLVRSLQFVEVWPYSKERKKERKLNLLWNRTWSTNSQWARAQLNQYR